MKAIRGSPFTCQTYDASKVVIDELKVKQFSINEKIAVNRECSTPTRYVMKQTGRCHSAC